jgi:hypothetical protein
MWLAKPLISYSLRPPDLKHRLAGIYFPKICCDPARLFRFPQTASFPSDHEFTQTPDGHAVAKIQNQLPGPHEL